MRILPIKMNDNVAMGKKYSVADMGKGVILPTVGRNYTEYNTELVEDYLNRGMPAVHEIIVFLKDDAPKTEEALTQALYILDRMIDKGVRGIRKDVYNYVGKYNTSESPNVQVLLAGIYRKTQPVEAFGPLCSMLIQNSVKIANGTMPKPEATHRGYFDPSEEIGGAILEYLRAKNAPCIYPTSK